MITGAAPGNLFTDAQLSSKSSFASNEEERQDFEKDEDKLREMQLRFIQMYRKLREEIDDKRKQDRDQVRETSEEQDEKIKNGLADYLKLLFCAERKNKKKNCQSKSELRKQRYDKLKEDLKKESDPQKQSKMYDDFLKWCYVDQNTTEDPLARRPEHERKTMAQLILQHEGENLVVSSKKAKIEKELQAYILKAMTVEKDKA